MEIYSKLHLNLGYSLVRNHSSWLVFCNLLSSKFKMNLLYALVLLIFMDFSLLLKHSRPRFWHYLAGPMLVLGAYYLHIWVSSETWIVYVVLLFFTTFFGNLFVYGVNDYYDGDTDKFNIKKQWYEEKLSLKSWMLSYIFKIHILFFLLVFISTYFIFRGRFFETNSITQYILETTGFLFHSWSILRSYILLMILCLWLFYLFSRIYSAPPIRAKGRPFWDGFTNVLYIIIPFCSYTALLSQQYGSVFAIEYFPIIPFIAARLRCIAMHCFSAIPDIEADTKAGVITTAVYLWKQKSLLYCIMLYAIAGMLASEVIGILWSLFGLLYCGMVMLWFRYDIFRIYKRFPYINFFVGMLLCFYVYFAL